MTMKTWILSGVFAVAASACATEGTVVDGKAKHLESCFSNGLAIACVPTARPMIEGMDLDGDGVREAFVCADMESDSDSADDDGSAGGGVSDSDSTSDADTCVDDSSSDSTSDSASDSDGDSDGDLDGDSDVDSDSDSDGDDDGVPDEIDCDCGGTTPPGDDSPAGDPVP
ncbi:MAG: hypothetical protein D6689_03980 [Deltaproteobacteria bacterium]|nr:MAG: hypothetical protein D6689_03980 [Deltaproteobacteria bacterium]